MFFQTAVTALGGGEMKYITHISKVLSAQVMQPSCISLWQAAVPVHTLALYASDDFNDDDISRLYGILNCCLRHT